MTRSLLVALGFCAVSGSVLANGETGEVSTWKSSAKFTETSVVGPKLSVYRRSDGSWAGVFQGLPIDLTSYKDWLVGLDVTLRVVRTHDFLILDGTFRNRFVHYEWPTHPDQIESYWWKVYGHTAGYVHATGAAAEPHPPVAQLALAILAVN